LVLRFSGSNVGVKVLYFILSFRFTSNYVQAVKAKAMSFLLNRFDKEKSSKVKVKLLLAISALYKNCIPATVTFLKQGGVQLVFKSLVDKGTFPD